LVWESLKHRSRQSLSSRRIWRYSLALSLGVWYLCFPSGRVLSKFAWASLLFDPQKKSVASTSSPRYEWPDPHLKNYQNGKLTLAELHDEYDETPVLLDEIIFKRYDIRVIHGGQQVQFFQILCQVGL
jgi:hypothetical protein